MKKRYFIFCLIIASIIPSFLFALQGYTPSSGGEVEGQGQFTFPEKYKKLAIGLGLILVLLYLWNKYQQHQRMKTHRRNFDARLSGKKKVDYKYRR